jgi:SAM-dependent methyltransferase
MDFARFDRRHYPTVSVEEGYGAWAANYETPVLDELDLRLLERIQTVPWGRIETAADLACGTGRIGAWLKARGVGAIDGVDMTAEMLAQANEKGVYRQVLCGDMLHTPLPSTTYDLVTEVLADEHIPAVAPLYAEAARLARPGGHFVLVGYHPYFLLNGIPTHFDRAPGEPVAIQSYVHLTSEHVQAALAAGWTLAEMREGIVDDAWLEYKPHWQPLAGQPVSFALVWRKQA